jgi:mRNA interferase MazF
VISCDNVTTILVTDLGEQIGFLLPSQEHALTDALSAAFDLE